MMNVLCGRSRTLQIVDGAQTSIFSSERIQPSSFRTHEGSRSRLAHIRTELSSEPETIWLPSGENATEITDPVCPRSSLSCSPVFPSHTRTETIRWPSGENATDKTDPLRPCSSLSNPPVFASHSRTEVSEEPEIIWWPSGENATERTGSVCPRSSLSCSPVFPSHTRTDLSQEPETIRL